MKNDLTLFFVAWAIIAAAAVLFVVKFGAPSSPQQPAPETYVPEAEFYFGAEYNAEPVVFVVCSDETALHNGENAEQN